MASEKMKIDPTGRAMLTDKKEMNKNQSQCTSQLVANGGAWADIVVNKAKTFGNTEENIDDNGWTITSSQNQNKKTWRQRLNILRDTATSESDGGNVIS